jgi:hypothetical protein
MLKRLQRFDMNVMGGKVIEVVERQKMVIELFNHGVPESSATPHSYIAQVYR